MARKSPSPLQKLVRGMIRDIVTQANSQKADKPATPRSKKSVATQSKSKKRSRHISPSVRVSVLHRDGKKCILCGRSSREVKLEIDHIVPFSQGGSNQLSNLQTLCFDCNRGKGARYLK